MKKLLLLLTTALFVSCSSEDQITVKDSTTQNSLSTLDDKVLSFKDDKSFIQEYNDLTKLKTGKELQEWVSNKGHSSLLNLKKSEEDQESESDVRGANYSDALRAILNSDSKVKIGGKMIWLDDYKFYNLLANNENKSQAELRSLVASLEVYGSISGLDSNSSVTSRAIPNANRSKEWVYGYNNGRREKRVVLILFNETIYLNSVVQSTKMFVKVVSEGKYCSTWKCRWNSEDGGKVTLSLWYNSNWVGGSGVSQLSDGNNTIMVSFGADWSPNFVINGLATVTWVDGQNGITKTWSQDLSWY